MAKMLDSGLEVVVFEFQSHYYVDFWSNTIGKGMNSLIPPATYQIVSVLFFYKDSIGTE